MNSESWENREKCQQLVFQYYMKSEDLENKCTILHRNLQEVKDAWDRTKIVRDDALKEKETMTIKYATSEKKVLDERKLKEKFQKTCDELNKENNTLQHKLQAMIEEKTRICHMYDNKIYELKALQLENNRIKNDNCILQNELKLCQKALKQQAESYNKSQTLIENLSTMKSVEKVKQDTRATAELTEGLMEPQENQGCLFSERVQEQKSLLKEVTQSNVYDEKKDVETNLSPLEILEFKYEGVNQENHTFLQNMKELEVEKLELTKAFKIWVDPLLQTETNLQMNSLEPDLCTMHLMNKSEQLKALNVNFNLLKSKNADLEIDIEACRHREADALMFTQRATDTATKLQSDYNFLEKKFEQLRGEHKSLKKVNLEYKSQCDNLMKQLKEEELNNSNEKMNYSKEINLLRKELSASCMKNLQLKQQVYDCREDIDIIRRKHNFSLREMQKQLGSKNTEIIRYFDKKPNYSLLYKSCSNDQVKVIQPECKIEPKTFIERIVKLQRINARKSEKLDFLEDQVNTLLSELQKKSKLILIYMLRDRTDALTSNIMDDCKNDLTKGIMASINSASVADKHLTLDLSLQINQKLQAVLEDALLENIILKENIDKLSHEIEKLDRQLKG